MGPITRRCLHAQCLTYLAGDKARTLVQILRAFSSDRVMQEMSRKTVRAALSTSTFPATWFAVMVFVDGLLLRDVIEITI